MCYIYYPQNHDLTSKKFKVMKQFIAFSFGFFLFSAMFGQVGINTTTPNAMLDIRSSNQATPANTDGVLLPLIDEFPTTNPGANQDGMLVFVSGNGTSARGLYYWDNSGSSWISLSNGWQLTGNSGTVAGTDFIGTTDNQDLVFKANNLERMRLTTTGQIELSTNSTIIGQNAGGTGTNFSYNTAVGHGALRDMTGSALQNVAVGGFTLRDCTSCSDNIAMGHGALALLQSTSRNIAIGHYALLNNITGIANTAIGWSAGTNNVGEYNVFLGYTAGFNETGSNRLYIENSSTATPLIGGDFTNNRVGINRSIGALTNTLEVGGTASKNTAGGWLANSDRRLKTNIQGINGVDALRMLNQMRGVTFEWNDRKTEIPRPTGIQYGFIAQELMEVFPQKVTKDKSGFYQTAYGDYDPLVIEAIKELNRKLDEKDIQIESLLRRLKKMEESLGTINLTTNLEKNATQGN